MRSSNSVSACLSSRLSRRCKFRSPLQHLVLSIKSSADFDVQRASPCHVLDNLMGCLAVSWYRRYLIYQLLNVGTAEICKWLCLSSSWLDRSGPPLFREGICVPFTERNTPRYTSPSRTCLSELSTSWTTQKNVLTGSSLVKPYQEIDQAVKRAWSIMITPSRRKLYAKN